MASLRAAESGRLPARRCDSVDADTPMASARSRFAILRMAMAARIATRSMGSFVALPPMAAVDHRGKLAEHKESARTLSGPRR